MNYPRPRPLSNRSVYLIADLHLEVGRPETIQLFLDFLSGPVREAQSLYILGDLFEVWIGDDSPSPTAKQVSPALKSLADAGVGIFFLCGNRDFLLGDAYCRRAGMQRLQEPVQLPGFGPATALIHGDTLCTDDADYQRFRKKVRDPEWQRRMLAKPQWWRKIVSLVARAISRRRNLRKPAQIMDVNASAVAEAFRGLAVDRLIHGHTHRPAIHQLDLGDRVASRIVLGDWHGDQGSTVRIEPTGRLDLLDITYDAHGEIELTRVVSRPAF